MTPPQFPPTYTPIKLSDPLMLIVDPLTSNSTFLPMPVSDDPPDAILNPPAMSEPDAERSRQRLRRLPRRRPRQRTRRHQTPLCSCRAARPCPGRNVIVVLLAIIIPVPILFRLR